MTYISRDKFSRATYPRSWQLREDVDFLGILTKELGLNEAKAKDTLKKSYKSEVSRNFVKASLYIAGVGIVPYEAISDAYDAVKQGNYVRAFRCAFFGLIAGVGTVALKSALQAGASLVPIIQNFTQDLFDKTKSYVFLRDDLGPKYSALKERYFGKSQSYTMENSKFAPAAS